MYMLLWVYCVVICIDFFFIFFSVVEECVIGIVEFCIVCDIVGFVCGVIDV